MQVVQLYLHQLQSASSLWQIAVMDLRSGCPINLSVELIGDRWSLVILRDMMFGNRRSYGELLSQSLEGIASNILASRLRTLQSDGLISRAGVAGHKQKVRYSLTEHGIALVPVMAALGAWGRRFRPFDPMFDARAHVLEYGGAPLWEHFMEELRSEHLGLPMPAGRPLVGAQLQAAYDEGMRLLKR